MKKLNISRLFKPNFLMLFFLYLLPGIILGQDNDSNLATRTTMIDLDQFTQQLAAAPMERTTRARSAPLLMELPMPDGTYKTFNIIESPIMSPDFAAQYPNFKTYMVQDVVNPAISGRISVTPYGYNAVILTPEGMIHARPVDINNPIQHEISLAPARQ